MPTVVPSSSGGIPLAVEDDRVLVEDYVSSDDENVHVTNQEALERMSVHKASKAAFAVNIEDRCELFKLRKKWQDMECLLKKKGISLAELEKEQIQGDVLFNEGLHDVLRASKGRDEFGLPKFGAQPGTSRV